MLMPFGKYRGVPLDDIRTSYLVWLVENVDLREPLAGAVRGELYARGIDVYSDPEDDAA